ncbi:MAG: MiaB/RimO family radical SAM methylthiotransferase [Endomicrobia bacterium]|nr:MiaB/RimO family radical SAM methylthiotransferase [Bacillota bacterium]MCL1971657.1 MiaB/RimO family radical SAM methylthiotransferase [Endomicrobiia bacterium]
MKTYYIHTFGCKVNQYETQLISEKFKKDGFTQAAKPEEADIIVFNSCTVTAEADKECEYFLRKASKFSKPVKLIVTGCFARNKKDYIKEKFPGINVITEKLELFSEPQKQTIHAFDKRSRAFVKIQDGCNSFCSYCIVPYVRNNLWSKPVEIVIEEIKNLVNNGYPEIVLTGIHVGKYEGGIAPLIEQIIKIPLDFRIRISSIELNEINDALIELMKKNQDKICRHLHIPLQSGSDEILKLMNRHYTTADFAKKVKNIITEFPELALTSDIITGFPQETRAHHKETCDFIKRMPFARFHIFRYSDRDGTKASSFSGKVAPDEIKSRSNDLFEIDALKRTKFLSKNIGKKRPAVSIGKNKALTDNYITVKIPERKPGIFTLAVTQESEI